MLLVICETFCLVFAVSQSGPHQLSSMLRVFLVGFGSSLLL